MPLLETKGAASAQGFGEFAKSGPANYIEDVFQTWLYTGNGSTQTITNGIDLSGKGGLVWIKGRSGATAHALYDTARGTTKDLVSNSTAAETTQSTGLTAFSSTGFSIGALAKLNTNAATYASWTFREQAKFFDIVTYTGNGSNRTIAHNLGSVPGCIIIKRTDTTAAWAVYHRSLANTEYLVLNTDAFAATGATYWNSTTPTATQFSLGTATDVNANGGTYVAYLFAHNAGGFGLTGTDNVISCGSFQTNGSNTNLDVTLGYEPQWLLVKPVDGTGNWYLADSMRGFVANPGTTTSVVYSNLSDAESTWNIVWGPTATGFQWRQNISYQYIYIAIRRGPMKVPTSGTSVFSPVARTGTGGNTTTTAGFPVDLGMTGSRDATLEKFSTVDRLRANNYLITSATAAETVNAQYYQTNPFDSQTALNLAGGGSSATNFPTIGFVDYLFRRAPGFFDVVCYAGTSVTQNISHNLTVVPELIITKRRSTPYGWFCYSATGGADKYITLNTNNGFVTDTGPWNNTSPTSSVFTVGNFRTNFSGETYVAYLFATCPGVSKVGSYTGTGALQTVNCGFTGGARFVLIKRTDSTGDWYVYDSARGITSGNDPYLLLNSTAAEITGTNYVDTDTTGFKVTAAAPAELNASGGTYIFLAIA